MYPVKVNESVKIFNVGTDISSADLWVMMQHKNILVSNCSLIKTAWDFYDNRSTIIN